MAIDVSCKHCGHKVLRPVTPRENKTHAFAIVDKTSGEFPNTWLPVELYACEQCKAVVIVAPTIRT
jgi:hypothetical protein